MNYTNVIEAATAYASKGYAVFPIIHGKKTPATGHGFHDATKNLDDISQMFDKTNLNIGIATGEKSGLVVIDVDTYKGGDVTLLEKHYGALPTTMEAKTRAGGRHLFYKYPSGRTIGSYNNKIAPHIDIKASGGYVVAAPSYVEKDNKGPAGYYEFINDNEPTYLPDAWIDALEALGERKKDTVFGDVPDFVRKAAIGSLLSLDTGLAETPENIEWVNALLSHIPAAVADGCDRDLYMKVVWSLASTGWGCAEQIARDWCLRSPADFDERDFQRDWGSYDPARANGIGFGTLVHLATERGYAGHDVAKTDGAIESVKYEWPAPKLINSPVPGVKAFDLSLLPDAFVQYVADHAELMQAPPEYVAVPLMVAAASALGNVMAIAPKERDISWLVAAILWGGIVGRPGTSKSPATSRGLAPLSILEDEMQRAFGRMCQQYQADKLRYEAECAKAKAEIKKGVAGVTVPTEPEEPQPERLLVNDSTYQKLTEILRWSPRGVLVMRDELVSLLEGLAVEGQEGARGFYLEAWNGYGSYRVDRVGRGSFTLKNPTINIVGGIQPGKLQSYVKSAVFGGNSDDGLLQRFQMLVWPDPLTTWTNVDRRPNLEAQIKVESAIKALRDLDPVAIGANVDQLGNRPPYLHFTTEAQVTFNKFREKLEVSLRDGSKHPALESHLSKYRSLVPSLALIIHLVDGGTGPVTKVALIKAIGWSNYLWSHARRVYACVTDSAGFAAKALADKIAAGKLETGFTARQLTRHGWQHLTNGDDVCNALEWLTDANWIFPVQQKPTEKGGRSTVVYLINPKALTK